MGSQKNHSRRRKRKFYGNQSVGPKKLKVNTEGNNSCLRLRKLEKSFEDVLLLDEQSNDYNVIQRTLNLEMIYHVACVMLIKPIFFVETVVIKNSHIHQNNHRKCQKVKDVENLILT